MKQHGGDIYFDKDLLDFSVNINPLGMPETVKTAAKNSIDDCIHYPDVLCRELKAKTAKFENVPESYIIFGNGAADIIYRLVHTKRPRKALLTTPAFSEYEQALGSVDCAVSHHKLLESECFTINECILFQLSQHVDICFLCNPNNPTGQTISKRLLLQIADCCHKNNILLVIDECFIDFAPNSEHASMKSHLEEYPNIFILKAFTKAYAMPGLRLGYGLCANADLIAKISEFSQPWSVSIPAQQAGIAALEEHKYIERARLLVSEQRDFLESELTKLSIKVYKSSANFILFYSHNRLLQEELLKHKILIRKCGNFDGLDDHYYRIAVKTHEENLQLLRAMIEILLGDK